MTDPAFPFTLALVTGFLFGVAYFACLWLSVRALTGPRRQWRAFAAGSLVRLGAVLTLLAAVLWMDVDPAHFLPGLLGFLAARLFATAPGGGAAGRKRR
ncbi:MAG: ATP synthase subunit I [Alphaproteobacteria bacterium]